MPLTNAQVQAIVAEPLWKRVREEDSITQISGTPTVVTRVLVRCLVLTGRDEDLDAVKLYLGTVTEYTNPQTAQGRAQPGVWKNGGHYVEDGAVDLNKPSEKTWNLYQVLYKGTESTLTFVVERTCAMLVEAIKYWGLATLPVLPSVTEGAGITYEMVSYQQDSKTGAWNVIVLKRTRQYQNIGPYDSEQGMLATETTQKQLGVTNQAVPTIIATVGQIQQQDKTRNADCSLNVQTVIKTAQPVEDADTHGGPLVTEAIEVKRNQAALPNPGAGAAGQIIDVSGSINEYGRVDYVKTTRTAQAAADADTHGGPLVVEAVEVKRNQSALPNPGAGAAGTIIDVAGSINEFGKVDYVKTTRTAQAAEDADTHGGPLVVEAVEVKRNQASLPSPGAGAAGTIIDVSGNINEFGKVDYIKTTRTAQAAQDSDTHGGPLVTESIEVKRNQSALPNPGAGAAGTIIDVSGNINEFGKVDFVKTTRTATAAEDADTHGGPLVVESIEVKRNQSALPSPGAGAAGTIIDVAGNINEFGKVDFVKTTRTAQAAQDTAGTAGSPGETVAITLKRNQTSMPALGAGGAGVTHELSGSINEFGRIDFVQRVVTKQDESVTAYTAIKTPNQTSTRQVFTGAAAQPTLSEEYGQLNVQKRDGLWYGEKIVVTYNDVDPVQPAVNVTDVTATRKERVFNSDYSKYRDISWTHHSICKKSRADALSAVDNGYKADVNQIGGGWFVAEWRTDITVGAWTNT